MPLRWMRLPLPLSLAGLLGLAQAAPLTFNAAFDQAESGAPALAAQRAPMVGGMITAPLLSMFVVPAAYRLMRVKKPSSRALPETALANQSIREK